MLTIFSPVSGSMRARSDSGLSSESCETHDGNYREASLPPEAFQICLRERIRYVERQMRKIKTAKAEFGEKCGELSKTIDFLTGTITACAKSKERELQTHLENVRTNTIAKLEQQLNICQEAEELLDGPQIPAKNLQTACNHYAQNIGFINGGDIQLPVDPSAVLEELNSFGEFIHENVSTGQPKFLPRGRREGIMEFSKPWGVCCDPTGRILVTDRVSNMIKVFNENGEFLIQFGGVGSGPGEFRNPTGIAVDKKCRVIVADKDNHRVQVFSYFGRFLFTFGGKGTASGLFSYPWDVAVNDDGNIAVSDSRNHRIQLFDCYGNFLTKFDFSRGGPRQKVSPGGLIFKPDGSLLVTDFSNHSALLISKDFTRVVRWEENPSRAKGIHHGAFAVADRGNQQGVSVVFSDKFTTDFRRTLCSGCLVSARRKFCRVSKRTANV